VVNILSIIVYMFNSIHFFSTFHVKNRKLQAKFKQFFMCKQTFALMCKQTDLYVQKTNYVQTTN